MSLFRAIGIALFAFAVSLHPAFATLMVDFSASPSVIQAGQSTTLHLLLTPVFDKPSDEFNLGSFTFLSGDGQTSPDLSPGGQLLAALDLHYDFTYLSPGTFTAQVIGAASETFIDPGTGGFVIVDYFFGSLGAPLTTEVQVNAANVPEPATLSLFGAGVLAWIFGRRRNAQSTRKGKLASVALAQ
jgi:hypothetical protein